MAIPLSALLINPWITDYAAYNLWAEPLGLFYVAAALENAGAELSIIDCLFSKEFPNPRPRSDGRSKYLRTAVKSPDCLDWVEREYARYGMSEEEFLIHLSQRKKPDVVLITSMMTYWYPGVIKAVELIRLRFGKSIPIILGGVYAILCGEHAMRTCGVDTVYRSEDLAGVIGLLEGVTGKSLKHETDLSSFSQYPQPLHGFGIPRHFFSVLSGTGCPFSCSYCASHLINPLITRRNRASILDELSMSSSALGTRNVAFYDDALLYDAEQHIIPLLRYIIEGKMDLSIHLPNGIHARYVTAEIAGLFRTAGVHTVRIGLETSDVRLQKNTGRKTLNAEYRRAVGHFRDAGYERTDVGTYVMLGLPGQTPRDVEKTIELAQRSGAAPHISYFSPIPGTSIWEAAASSTSLPMEDEPLYQNNTVFILRNSAFSQEALSELKQQAIECRSMA
jgi:radical SAM superfamily enzyme YgiQ (UPF0313 family)